MARLARPVPPGEGRVTGRHPPPSADCAWSLQVKTQVNSKELGPRRMSATGDRAGDGLVREAL